MNKLEILEALAVAAWNRSMLAADEAQDVYAEYQESSGLADIAYTKYINARAAATTAKKCRK